MAQQFSEQEKEAARLAARMILAGFGLEDVDPADREALETLLAEHPEFAPEYEKISDSEELMARLAQLRRIKSRMTRDRGRLEEILVGNEQRIGTRHWIGIRKMIGIAASLIVISPLVYLTQYRRPHSQPESVTLTKDIAPGEDKAILTLANGQQVILDSANKGTIAQQAGIQVVNLGNGQIQYQGTSEISAPLSFNTLTTARGQQFKVILPDGTQVWLDAESSIRYPTVFNRSTRNVNLKGQAFFQVAHHPEPLIITTRKSKIYDLSTAFNVSAYEDDAAETITLCEGKVKVQTGGLSRIMAPGQQAQIADSSAIHIVDGVNIDQVVAWKNGYFQFDGADMASIIKSLSRWYNISIIDSSGMSSRGFLLTVDRKVPVSVIMRAFERTNHLHYQINGNSLILKP
jgi:transmembrane sensor